jgi:hypothetical protein
MAAKRSIYCLLLLPLLLSLLIWIPSISLAATNPDDVAAINGLFAALGAPVLPGWIASGGDPCGEAWQGIICNVSDIISITVNAANLQGELGDNLAKFTSIRGMYALDTKCDIFDKSNWIFLLTFCIFFTYLQRFQQQSHWRKHTFYFAGYIAAFFSFS